MREILFRGKKCNNGEWIEGGIGNVCTDENTTYIIYTYRYIPDTRDWDTAEFYENHPHYKIGYVAVEPATVGQYTGLTDIHGIKVFEGDIIKCYTGRICKVTFFTTPSYSGFDLTAIDNLDKPAPHSWRLFEDMEVIGNIYDNPEFLI